MTPHPYQTVPKGYRCRFCGGLASDPCHNHELFTDADREREAARQLAEAEELTQQMRRPIKNVSAAAGNMEREAPLFFGTGANPSLF